MGVTEFQVNRYLSLKLEGARTVIYVDGEPFNQCKNLALKHEEREIIPPERFESIDQVLEQPFPSIHVHRMKSPPKYCFPPQDIFWGHCSALQAWDENDYDTRLLHKTFAFPLLRALAKAGDTKAKVSFQRELLSRMGSGFHPVVKYLAWLVQEDEECLDEEGTMQFIKIIEELSTHEDKWDRVTVARNRLTPTPILEKLIGDEEKYVKIHAASNKNLPPHLFKELAKSENIDIKEGLAKNPSTPVEILEALSREEEPRLRRALMNNKGAPVEFLLSLLKNNETNMLGSIQYDVNTPKPVLEALASQDNEYTRSTVARNKNLPWSALEKVSVDPVINVRKSLALNKKLPESITEILANDAESEVRRWVAFNENTPQRILEVLSKDVDARVRRYAAYNKNTPVSSLRTLSKDVDSGVRSQVGSNENAPPDVFEILAKDEDSKTRRAAGRNSNMVPRILSVLARDDDARVRSAVGVNPNTPVNSLLALVFDEDGLVRGAVARNVSVPPCLLEILAEDPVKRVVMDAASNYNAPWDVKARHVDEMIEYFTTTEVRSVIKRYPPPTHVYDAKPPSIEGALNSHFMYLAHPNLDPAGKLHLLRVFVKRIAKQKPVVFNKMVRYPMNYLLLAGEMLCHIMEVGNVTGGLPENFTTETDFCIAILVKSVSAMTWFSGMSRESYDDVCIYSVDALITEIKEYSKRILERSTSNENGICSTNLHQRVEAMYNEMHPKILERGARFPVKGWAPRICTGPRNDAGELVPMGNALKVKNFHEIVKCLNRWDQFVLVDAIIDDPEAITVDKRDIRVKESAYLVSPRALNEPRYLPNTKLKKNLEELEKLGILVREESGFRLGEDAKPLIAHFFPRAFMRELSFRPDKIFPEDIKGF